MHIHVSFKSGKGLKRIVYKKTGEFPSKTHDLIYFVDRMELDINNSYYEFLYTLNKISVPTHYPDDLRKLFASYTKERTIFILNQTRVVQLWIKQQ